MSNVRTRIASCLFIALVMVTGAMAQTLKRTQMHEEGMFGEHALSFFADILNLTDAQQTQIKQIMDKAKPNLQPLFEQEMKSREAMIQLVTSGNFEEAKAQSIASQASQVHSQLMVEHARAFSEAYQVLTPDQKTRLLEFMAKRHQRMQEHMQAPANP